MRRVFSKIVLVTFLLAVGCKDEDGGANFEGIIARDSDNQLLGSIGKKDLNDWKNDGTLSQEILDLLATTPDLNLTGTDDGDISVTAYPNPSTNMVKFLVAIEGGPCLLEYVIVNEKMKVLHSGSFVAGNQQLTFDVSDRSKFPNKSVVRMFYSFSSDGNPNFYVGHGDILICDQTAHDCF